MTVRVDETKRDIVVSTVRRRAARGVNSSSASASLPGSAAAARRLLTLGLVPQRVHLVERCVLERTALRRQRALDIGEAALELGVGAAQRGFRIGADMARQIDQREQEIAGFVREFVRVAAVERGLDLVGLLADLVSTARGSFQSKPTVEALRCNSIARVSAGWPALTLESSDLCVGLFRRPPRGALGLFLGLDALPGALDAGGRRYCRPCRRTHADAGGSSSA